MPPHQTTGVVGLAYSLPIPRLLVASWWIVVPESLLVMASASLVDWPVWSLHAAMFVFSKGTLDCWVAGSAWCWCWWLSARAVIDTTIGVAW